MMTEKRLQPGYLVKGRYRILDVIHKGFFGTYGDALKDISEKADLHADLYDDYAGTIYRARAMGLPDTPLCVLKEIIIYKGILEKGGEILEQVTGNFSRQVAILSAIKHPAIPHIFDDFVSGRGAYLVMEYISGKDLVAILNDSDEDLPVEQVVDWAIQICDALSYLHKNRPPFIFRHLQPSHVMLDHQGCIKLVDFGLSFWLKGEITGEIYPVLEPYQPLEQVRYLHEHAYPIYPTYDTYSLGATLYRLLTRREPRSEQKPRERIKTRPDVPGAMIDIVMKALEFSPSNRYQSAAEMKEALLTVRKTL